MSTLAWDGYHGRESDHRAPAICGVICHCGPNGEPLGCGYPKGHHPTEHSWASLPTFVRSVPEARCTCPCGKGTNPGCQVHP